jgi:predicted F0F1-ATPase subunit
MTRDDRLSEMRHAVERDAARVTKPHDHGTLLRAMGLIGSVGWPIALLTCGGAVLGHWIDRRFGSGVSATLTLVTVGALVGSALAARSVRAKDGS